jgi:hypothetical protein
MFRERSSGIFILRLTHVAYDDESVLPVGCISAPVAVLPVSAVCVEAAELLALLLPPLVLALSPPVFFSVA